MKKVKGFTLIELIVVIAIISILAMILIPALMGWMSKSRITTYNNNAKEIYTQLQLIMSECTGTNEIPDCEINYDGTVFNSNTTLSATQITKLKSVNDGVTDMTNVAWAARIQNNNAKCISVTKNNCIDVGGFPVQCPPSAKYSLTNNNIEFYLDYADGTSSWSTLEAN